MGHQIPEMFRLLLLVAATLASAITYRLAVYAPSTEIDGAKIDASANGFYLGLSRPSTYCPIGAACPAVRGTLVYEGLAAMAVEVPGGQLIYITPDGQVKYTQAHSAYIPQESFTGGWFNKTVVSNCGPDAEIIDFMVIDGANVGGVMLCPNIQNFMEGSGASYQLYARTRRFNESNCVRALGLIQHESPVTFGAWQYT